MATVELSKIAQDDDRVIVKLDLNEEIPDGDGTEAVTVTGEVVFEELFYRRNDRGTPEPETGRSKLVSVSEDEAVQSAEYDAISTEHDAPATERDGSLSVQIPLPAEFRTENAYVDVSLDVTLTVEIPGDDEPLEISVEDEPIVVGEPRFTIDPDDEKQPIDGFGASGAWWAQNVGGWEGKRESIAEWLFSTDEGIGLSVYRYNATGGEMPDIENDWRTGETYEVDRGEYDWSRDENGRWVLQAADERGVETLILFTKTPPARLTENNKTYAEAEIDSNLDPDNYGQFAQYLADIATHFREEGIEFDLVSPINEPEWDWIEPNQEGTPYTVPQIRELTHVLLDTFEREDVRADLLIPETGAWRFVYDDDRNYAEQLHEDSRLREEISVLAAHSYWSSDEERHAAAEAMAAYPETRIWQTEWCEMVPGRDQGMDFALDLVNTVHSDLTIANASSWQFWLAVSEVDYKDGLIYVDKETREVTDAKALWAFGNYTRYIRPGAVRIGVEDNRTATPAWRNDAGVTLSAYLGPDREEIVVVAINETERETTARLAIESDASALAVTPHRTSADESLETLEDVTIDSRDADRLAGEVTLAPRSVTTFTGELR